MFKPLKRLVWRRGDDCTGLKPGVNGRSADWEEDDQTAKQKYGTRRMNLTAEYGIGVLHKVTRKRRTAKGAEIKTAEYTEYAEGK
jgi:hypothetical protein